MKPIVTFLFCFLLQLCAFAEPFSFSRYTTTISRSDRFARVTVIDRRADTGRVIGKVKINAAAGLEDLVSEHAFHEELGTWYFDHCKRQSNETDLVVVVYSFTAEELPEHPLSDRESARFSYSADFFSGNSEGVYHLLGSADTSCTIHAYNVTESLYSLIDKTLTASYKVARSLPLASDKPYAYAEVLAHHQDSYKSTLPFNGKALPEQAYFEDWNDFKAMRGATDKTFVKKSDYVTVYRIRKGKKNIMTYATGQVLIYEGTPYYQMNATYREMILKDGEYWIKSPIYAERYAPKQKVYVLEPYECRIDSRTGRVIPVKQLSIDDDLGKSLGISRMAGFIN